MNTDKSSSPSLLLPPLPRYHSANGLVQGVVYLQSSSMCHPPTPPWWLSNHCWPPRECPSNSGDGVPCSIPTPDSQQCGDYTTSTVGKIWLVALPCSSSPWLAPKRISYICPLADNQLCLEHSTLDSSGFFHPAEIPPWQPLCLQSILPIHLFHIVTATVHASTRTA